MKVYSQVHMLECLREGESTFELCQSISERAHEINVSGESTASNPGDNSSIILAMLERVAEKNSNSA